MTDKISVAIAEDHSLVRAGFVRMLSDYSHIYVVFEAGNGRELLKGLLVFKPAVILLDIAMPSMGGIKAMEKIRKRYPRQKIIVISAFAEEASIVEYVKLGANGFLYKDCEVGHLIHTIQEVYLKGDSFDERSRRMLSRNGILVGPQSHQRELTEREIQILKLLSSNTPAARIAEQMGIKERTVEWYKHILLQKTQCKDLPALVAYAFKEGIAGV